MLDVDDGRALEKLAIDDRIIFLFFGTNNLVILPEKFLIKMD